MLSWVHGCPSRIKAWKDPGEPVVYMRGSAFKSAKELARRLTNRIRRGDLEPSSIFVLAQSVRPGPGETPPPIIILENKLVEAGIPCFSPDSDEESLDDTTIEGKVVFSSIHQSKGLERPVVVCFGFDLGWYEFYGKESDTTTCPNVWYVALTRATKQLMLVAEHSPGQHIPFLRVERLRELAKGSGAHRPPVVEIVESERFAADTSTAAETMKLDRKFSRATVTELTRYMSDGQIEKAFTCLNPKRLAEASMSIKVPDTVPGVGDLVEYVADINGVALIAMYEQMSDSSGDASIIDTLRQTDWASTAAAKDLYEQAQKLIKRALKPPCDPATFLQLASIYQSLGSGFVARPFQVPIPLLLSLCCPRFFLLARHAVIFPPMCTPGPFFHFRYSLHTPLLPPLCRTPPPPPRRSHIPALALPALALPSGPQPQPRPLARVPSHLPTPTICASTAPRSSLPYSAPTPPSPPGTAPQHWPCTGQELFMQRCACPRRSKAGIISPRAA